MFFYLDFEWNSPHQLNTKIVEQISAPCHLEKQKLYLQEGQQQLYTWEFAGDQLILLGDPVFPSEKAIPAALLQSNGELDETILYERIKGHYYWFLVHHQEIRCGTSFGAIFPLYYLPNKEGIQISSSSQFLAQHHSGLTPNRRNLLERLLFNYPFFNSTWWEEMSLLPAHRYLYLDKDGFQLKGQFALSNYFGQVEDRSADSLRYLVDLFQKETLSFFPEAPFAISLTGGFDGRTLVAAALRANQKFKTYSFGRPGSSDVTVPERQSKKLGIPYQPIYLDQRYIREDAMNAAKRFMQLTDFNGNYSRPHYAYAAQKLSQEVPYILTGNFGSELFRALHIPGVMMSAALIEVFSTVDDSWKDALKKRLEPWGLEGFQTEFDALISDLEHYRQERDGWEANHQFYDFVFNEIFRKYFGPELIMQSHYFNNRTPYLNLEFFRELNRTIWSGVHARLFEKNKAKRMKGQMFYATFIREGHKKLYHLTTNKGYSPAEVLETWRFPFLVGKVVLKKFILKPEGDSNSVDAYFRKDAQKLVSWGTDTGISPAFSKLVGRSENEIQRGQHLQEWIRIYAILAGWQAAHTTLTKATPSF